jgi:hypothetical protein
MTAACLSSGSSELWPSPDRSLRNVGVLKLPCLDRGTPFRKLPCLFLNGTFFGTKSPRRLAQAVTLLNYIRNVPVRISGGTRTIVRLFVVLFSSSSTLKYATTSSFLINHELLTGSLIGIRNSLLPNTGRTPLLCSASRR